ncbi:MAG TPA: fibrobacter succinogenes major paralogous domain-containing protein [Lunatimonas sp.]|nr:fibrobacter succinogenes major paralogous domain-containing protein [Lunatimonas sp.]
MDTGKTNIFPILLVVNLLLFSCSKKEDKKWISEQPPYSSGENWSTDESKIEAEPCGIVRDIDGNDYNTFKIGEQIWMVKNLKTTKFNDGTPIPMIAGGDEWAGLSTSGYCWYDNDEASFKPSFGAMYNGYTVSTGKLCPTGWHIPTNEEWMALITYLGSDHVAGNRLKEAGTDFWVSPNTGANNESGFTALPGGLRYHDGQFHDFGFSGYWWTSTEYSESRSFFIFMDYESSNVFRFDNLKKIGFSVRCIKDE